MNNNQEEGVYGKELGLLLQDKINMKLKSFRAKCKAKIKKNGGVNPAEGLQESSGTSETRIENAVTQDLRNQEEVGKENEAEQAHPLPDPKEDQQHPQESHKRGRVLTTELIDREIISFQFHIDATKFPNTRGLSSNLDSWDVQCRKRNSGTWDMYYIHSTTGGNKLRSVTEVVNHLLPRDYTKLDPKDKKRKDIEAKEEYNNLEVGDSSALPAANVSLPKKRRKTKNKVGTKDSNLTKKKKIHGSSSSYSGPQEIEDKEKNLDVENVSTETLSILPKASIESSPNTSEVHYDVPLHDVETPPIPQVDNEAQHIIPINNGGLEDYVDNDFTLTKDEDASELARRLFPADDYLPTLW